MGGIEVYIILGIISYFAMILVSIVTVYSWIDSEKKLAAVNFVLVIVLSILTIVCFAKTPEEKVREEIVKENFNQGEINMEQFSLEKYLANPERKIVTRDRREVRIVCTNANCKDGTILALVRTDDSSDKFSAIIYDDFGRTSGLLTNLDLIFASDKATKKVGWMNVYETLNPNSLVDGCTVYKTEQEALETIDYTRNYIGIAKVEWEE